MTKTMTFDEWREMAGKLHNRAIACRNQIIDRMRETAKDAGLDPQIASLHAHNALVSREWGKPWPEVNYDLARKVQWLEQRSFEPENIANRIIDRAWQKVSQ